MAESKGNLGDHWGSLVGFDPVVDAERLNWANRDTHTNLLNQLGYYVMEAHNFRRKVTDDILKMARYQANLYLKATDTTSSEAQNKQAMAEKQARLAVKGRYFSVPILNGQGERRKALYGALPLDFECSRLTTCDDDYTVAEFLADLSNRFIKQQVELIKWPYVDKLTWEFRPILKVEWDTSGGVRRELPVLTEDEFTKYKRRTVRNKPMDDGTGFWQRDENEVLMNTPPSLTGTPVFAPLGPLEYLIDPACGWRGVRGARYFADQRVVDASEVFERWANENTEHGKAVAKLLLDWEWSPRLTISMAESEIWSLRDISSSATTATKGVMTEIFMRPRQHMGLTQGAHGLILTASGLDSGLSTDGLVLKWEPLRWPYDIPACDDASEIVDSHYYYGNSNNNLVGGLARGLNQTFSSMVKNAGRANKSWAFATGVDSRDGGKIDTTQLTPDDTLITVPGDQAKIQSVQFGGSAALMQGNLLTPFIEAISMATNASPGAMPSKELATIANRGLMYEASVANAVKERMGTAIVRAVLMGARMCQRYMSVKDFQAVLNDKDETEVFLFRDADLTHNTNIKLRTASFFAGNMDARMHVLAMAAQGRELFEKYVPGEQIRELLNMRDELGPTTEDRELERAENENAKMRRGPIGRKGPDGKWVVLAYEGVMETDNHAVHISKHLSPLSDPNRENLSIGYIERILRHIKQHAKLIQAARVEQMSDMILAEKLAANKMQAAGGQPAPAPTSVSSSGEAQ